MTTSYWIRLAHGFQCYDGRRTIYKFKYVIRRTEAIWPGRASDSEKIDSHNQSRHRADDGSIKVRYRLETSARPFDVFEVLQSTFARYDEDQEHSILFVLNAQHEMTGFKLISTGGQNYTTVDCKVLFRNALLLGASAIILAHNHPSGDLRPSDDDINVTAKIVQAGRVLDVEVLDHIIYTGKGYTSLRQSRPSLFGG